MTTQFRVTLSRRGPNVRWHVLDRLGGGSLASGEERNKQRAIAAANIRRDELAKAWTPVSKLLDSPIG